MAEIPLDTDSLGSNLILLNSIIRNMIQTKIFKNKVKIKMTIKNCIAVANYLAIVNINIRNRGQI